MHQSKAGATNTKTKINAGELAYTCLQMFEMFLPKKFIEEVIIPETNKSIIGQVLHYGKFLQWISLQLMIVTL